MQDLIFGGLDGDLDSTNYMSKIIAHQPNYLFNHTNIGYQNYFTDPDSIDLMDRLYFDHYRLGLVQQDLEQVEPMVRNADMLSFDISSVRFSDAPEPIPMPHLMVFTVKRPCDMSVRWFVRQTQQYRIL